MGRKFYFLLILIAYLFTLAMTGCAGGGSSTETGNPSYFGGTVQKGPFYGEQSVIIKELSDVDLEPTGVTHSTKISNDLGAFEFANSADITSTYVEISVTGYYFNEITGRQSLLPITLRAFIDITRTRQFNINILTTIAMKREKYLMVHTGKTYEEAKIQARNEILAAFKISPDITDDQQGEDVDLFAHMDIVQDEVKDSALLSLSVIISHYPLASVSTVTQSIGNDIETDGVIDDSLFISDLYSQSKDLDPSQIRTNLERYYESKSTSIQIPYFELFFELLIKPYIKAPPPIYSIPSATYNQDIAVQLYTITAGAEIYYTINGGNPTLYTNPIQISGDQTVAAINSWVVKSNMLDSDTVSSSYFIDYDYDAAQYKTDMSVADYRSSMVGTWIGHMESTATNLSPDNVTITISDAMQYSPQSLSYYYANDTNLSQVYYGWFGSEFYYRIDSNLDSKTIEVTEVYADGRAAANIVSISDYGVISSLGRLDQIEMSEDLNHLRFEFLPYNYYLPFTFYLTRQPQ